jgi:NADH:ubiquinone oxidoreductase subunit 6 (subunit J)
MCFFTGGLYQLYFFYKSWKYIDEGKNNMINPAFKSMFYFIFNFSLIESYLILSKKTNILYSIVFHLIVLLNISFILLNIIDDESIFIFNTLPYLVLIPFLNLKNKYFDKVQKEMKKRKWLSKEDVRILGWFWLIGIAFIVLLIIFN